MGNFDEVEIGCSQRGDVFVTDEKLSDGMILALVVSEAGPEGDWGYIELTLEEATQVRDELSRRIEAAPRG